MTSARALIERGHVGPTAVSKSQAIADTEAAMSRAAGHAVTLSAQQRHALDALFRPTR